MRKQLGMVGAVALALVVAACGGSGSDSSTSVAPTGTDTPTQTSEPTQAADPVEIRVTNLLGPGSAQSNMIDWFMAEWAAQTNGEVVPEVIHGGALVPGADTLAGLQQGRAEAGNLVPAYYPADMPLQNFLYVPVQNVTQVARTEVVNAMNASNDAIKTELSGLGMVFIGFLPNPTSAISLSSEITGLGSFQGKKIRIPSAPQSAVWTEAGVEPLFVPAEEVYESVERGLVNGVTYPFDVMVASGVTEVAPFIAPDAGESGGSLFVIAQEVFDRLSDNAKAVFAELQGAWSEKAAEELLAAETKACDTVLEQGGTIHIWSEADSAQLAEWDNTAGFGAWKNAATESGADTATVDGIWNEFLTGATDLSAASDIENGLVACASR